MDCDFVDRFVAIALLKNSHVFYDSKIFFCFIFLQTRKFGMVRSNAWQSEIKDVFFL